MTACPSRHRYHRRVDTATVAAVHTAEVVPTEPVDLTLVVAVWQAGNAGPVTLTVDGRTIATVAGDGTGIAPIRFERAERIEAGQTIALTMPTAGLADMNGYQP